MKCVMKMNLHDEGESLLEKNTANYQLPTDLIRRRELNRKTQKIYIYEKNKQLTLNEFIHIIKLPGQLHPCTIHIYRYICMAEIHLYLQTKRNYQKKEKSTHRETENTRSLKWCRLYVRS